MKLAKTFTKAFTCNNGPFLKLFGKNIFLELGSNSLKVNPPKIIDTLVTILTKLKSKLKSPEAATGGVLKKAALKTSAILTGKHLCWSLFFNKVFGLQACDFIKNRFQHR